MMIGMIHFSQLINVVAETHTTYFYTGGNFNYGRDPGWKMPGRPILNPVINNTKGIIYIFSIYS